MYSRRKNTIKYCAYALILVFFFVLQNARGTSIMLWGGSADVLPFIISAIAIFEGPYAAGAAGFAAGILSSIHSPVIEGLSALYLGLFGVLFGLLGAVYMRKVLFASLLGGCGCILLQGVIRYVFYYFLIYGMSPGDGALQLGAELGLSILPGVLIFYIIRSIHTRFSEAAA